MERLHPFTVFLYYGVLLSILMFHMDPAFVLLGILSGVLAATLGRERFPWKVFFLSLLPLGIFTILLRPLFWHRGVTVLFQVKGGAVTLETLLYGGLTLAFLGEIFLWLYSFRKEMGEEKILWLFGKTLPKVGLLLSMTLGLLPALGERYRMIRESRMALGEKNPGIKGRVKELSILLSWSLEASLDTADSMEARGYGLPGRTYYHFFRFTREDQRFVILTVVLGSGALLGTLRTKFRWQCYPGIVFQGVDALFLLALICFLLLAMLAPYENLKEAGKERKRTL